MTRRQKREQLERIQLGGEIWKVISHYFPDFVKQLKQVKDPRSKSYITYPSEMILLMRIVTAMGAVGSMRQLTEEMNHTNSIQNIGKLLGIQNLEELPHWSSINNFLERVSPEDLEELSRSLVTRLLRSRAFESNRYRKYWQVLIDGTQLYHFKERHCAHCLTRTYQKGTEREYTEYFHYVLEAKILLAPGLVVSIATEFIENPGSMATDKEKQDCELKAFYRLAKKLKHYFKRLPICLTFDSLYACKPVFRLCQENHWHFIVRFKEGSIPSVADEFRTLKSLSENLLTRTVGDSYESYRFVCGIAYDEFMLNCAELSIQSGKAQTSFVFLTDLSLSSRSVIRFIATGRLRWKIENEGFNTQKNLGYFISHPFSLNCTAMKNHYLLIQLAHALVQLCLLRLKTILPAFCSIRHFRDELLRNFRFFPICPVFDSG